AFYALQGGLLTYDDLAAFQVQVEEPVRARFREYEVFTCGPWCQGPVLAQVLTLLEPYDLAALGHNSPDYVHMLTEALQLVFDACSRRRSLWSSPPASATTSTRNSSTCPCAACSRNRMPTRAGSSSIPPARRPGCRRPAPRGASMARRPPGATSPRRSPRGWRRSTRRTCAPSTGAAISSPPRRAMAA